MQKKKRNQTRSIVHEDNRSYVLMSHVAVQLVQLLLRTQIRTVSEEHQLVSNKVREN